jgi:hypothetical protein
MPKVLPKLEKELATITDQEEVVHQSFVMV